MRLRTRARRCLAGSSAALAIGVFAAPPALAFEFLGTWGTMGSGDGQLNQPFDIAVEPRTGTQYVADTGNNRIVQFDPSGAFIRGWGGTGSGDTQFDGPNGVDVDDQSNVWVADANNARIKKFDPNGVLIQVFGTTGTNPGQLLSPDDVAVDAAGNFYVVEQGGGSVEKFTAAGDFVTTWAAPNPTGVAVADSRVYAANYNDDTVSVADTDGNPLPSIGASGAGAGQFNQPWHLAVDPSGNVWVADRANNRVQKFDPGGSFVDTFGWGVTDGGAAFQICTGPCQAGIFGAGQGQFGSTGGVGFDCRGNVYVVEQGNNRVQKFGEPGLAPLPCPAATGTPPTPSPPGGPPVAVKDTVRPVITGVRIFPGSFAAAAPARVQASGRRVARGTRIGYRLSEPASVRFTVERKSRGRRVGRRCRRATRRNRLRRRCTLHRRVGSFRRNGRPGANSKRFSGKLRRRALRPGPYRLTLVATDRAGNRSRPTRRSFRIVRRP